MGMRTRGAMPLAPTTSHVDDATRRKIRKREFVEFKKLVPTPGGEEQSSVRKLALVDGMFQEVEQRSFMPFMDWISAFMVFMSIHVEFHSYDIQGLIRHFEIVKRIYSNGDNALAYDRQFRSLMARNKDIRFGEYIGELLEVVKLGRQFEARRDGYRQGPRGGATGSGLCYRFNSQGGCRFGARCRFLHRCGKCQSANHPLQHCSNK